MLDLSNAPLKMGLLFKSQGTSLPKSYLSSPPGKHSETEAVYLVFFCFFVFVLFFYWNLQQFNDNENDIALWAREVVQFWKQVNISFERVEVAETI